MILEYKRALLRHALGLDFDRLLAIAIEDFGDEEFALVYIHAVVKRWLAEQLQPEVAHVRQLAQLVADLDARASAYEAELRAIYAAEQKAAQRKGWI